MPVAVSRSVHARVKSVYVRRDFVGVSWGLDARVDGFECGFVLACEQRKRLVLYYKTKLGGCVASGTNAWGDQPVKLLGFALDVCGRLSSEGRHQLIHVMQWDRSSRAS